MRNWPRYRNKCKSVLYMQIFPCSKQLKYICLDFIAFLEDFSWWRHEESYLNHFRPSETRKQARKLTSSLRLYLLSITNTLIYNIAQWAYVSSDQYVIN